jgi:hypothetical protein
MSAEIKPYPADLPAFCLVFPNTLTAPAFKHMNDNTAVIFNHRSYENELSVAETAYLA